MRRTRLLLLVVLITLASIVKPYQANAQVSVPIGVLISHSADPTSLIEMVDFIESDINEYMSVNGYDYVFDFITRDNEGEAATALDNVEYFRGQGIDLIVELGDESQAQTVISYVNDNEMLLVSSASSETTLSIPNDRLFRVAVNDLDQATILSEMWKSWGVETVVIMHRGNMWGDGFKDDFSAALTDLGINVLGYVRYDPNNPDVSSYVSYVNNIVIGSLSTYTNSEIGLQLISKSEVAAIQDKASQYPFLQSIIWMSTGDGGRSQAVLDEVGEYASQTRHFSPVLAINEDHSYWGDFTGQFSEIHAVDPDWNQALMYDALSLLSYCVADTGSSNPGVIADALIPYSSTFTGLTGALRLDVNGDRLPLLLDVWGYHEDPVSGTPSTRVWGNYDGQRNEVEWGDIDLINYGGLVRPAYMENPLLSYISCAISSTQLSIGSSQGVSSLLEPPLARTTVEYVFTKPDSTVVTRIAETDEYGFSFDTLTIDQAGTWRVYASWEGDGVHAETQSPSLTFNVEKHSSTIECSPYNRTIPIGEDIQVNCSISPIIEGRQVTITIEDPDGILTHKTVETDENGMAVASVIADKTGTWSYNAVWGGDDQHYGSMSSLKEVTVTKFTSTLSLEPSSTRVNPGSRILISGDLDPTRSDVPILLTLTHPDDTFEEMTIQTTFMGHYSIDITPSEPGLYTVKASWEGDENYAGSESTLSEITVKKMSSKLVIDVSEIMISAGESVTIIGHLEPSLSNALIEIFITKPDGSQDEVEVYTDSAGEYSIEYTLNEPRFYFVKASWQGNDRFNGSSSRTLETEVIDFQNMKINVKDTDGKIIEGATVTSTTQPSGQPTLTGLTNQEGFAYFEKVEAGSYSFLVTIEGYESNSGSLVVSAGDTSETTILLQIEEQEPESKGIPGFPPLSIILALALVILIISKRN